MTMHRIFAKLKKNSRKEYRQFEFSLTLAVLLISSYLLMLCSPLVQNTLPPGGDSRKLVYFIFAIAAAGCIIFCIYTTSLFLRFKSREIGVFLALGAEKGKLKKTLSGEMAQLTVICSVIGIVAGIAVSFAIGNLFEFIARKANTNHFSITGTGVASSLLYSLVLALFIAGMTGRFLKRSNVLEIINQQRKQEPLKQDVKKSYLVFGIFLAILGLLLGYVLPAVVAKVFKIFLGGFVNVFYLISLLGLYRIMVYSVAVHKMGKNKKKYYKNMISYGILKFQGASVVRNMLVITLLLMGGLFASFYAPMKNAGQKGAADQKEAGYSYRYTANADEVSKQDVYALAEKYKVKVENYREAEFIMVPGSGIEKSDLDKHGNLIEEYFDPYAMYEIISAKEFSRITGKKTKVDINEYYMIQKDGAYENIYYCFSDMDKLYKTDKTGPLEMKYKGNIIYNSLVIGDGFDSRARFVISDEDYRRLTEGAAKENRVIQVLFDIAESEDEVTFANELYHAYATRISENMNVCYYYDACGKERKGEAYSYLGAATFNPDNPAQAMDWKYEPDFVRLTQENDKLTYAVFYMMFLYVAFICMASVIVIAYTRSQSVGLQNRQVFLDLEKLGADKCYLRNILKWQVKKVYVLPSAIGIVTMMGFSLLIFWQNDGIFTAGERKTCFLIAAICVLAGALQYLMFRISERKAEKLLEL